GRGPMEVRADGAAAAAMVGVAPSVGLATGGRGAVGESGEAGEVAGAGTAGAGGHLAGPRGAGAGAAEAEAPGAGALGGRRAGLAGDEVGEEAAAYPGASGHGVGDGVGDQGLAAAVGGHSDRVRNLRGGEQGRPDERAVGLEVAEAVPVGGARLVEVGQRE